VLRVEQACMKAWTPDARACFTAAGTRDAIADCDRRLMPHPVQPTTAPPPVVREQPKPVH
jgi:hypothetical protein